MFTTYNFHYTYYENRNLPPYYARKTRDQEEIDQSEKKTNTSSVGVVLLIPPYLNYTKKDLKKGYSCVERSFWMGFAIHLPNHGDSNIFLRKQLGKKPYKNLRQDIQRLERDYQITFKTYYGSIDLPTYNTLMQTLKEYIQERFKGRAHKHSALQKWEQYEKSAYQMILEKKASIFAHFNNGVPICISLNYHYQNIFVAAIISFNKDFFSYSPGKQMFVKQIEWCFMNDYQLIDLGWGSFDYKIKFSNAVFKYRTHIVYPENSILKRFISSCLGLFLYVKYYAVMLKQRRLKRPSKTYAGRWIQFCISS
ncbi:GNAT family N-acetyltransferase [Muriicola sp. E247]|uniref:GNAT family N-acetyltransferase n=1 Tax=Muriicola sp. E247 TaxID=3242730 RepID=UPI00352443B4